MNGGALPDLAGRFGWLLAPVGVTLLALALPAAWTAQVADWTLPLARWIRGLFEWLGRELVFWTWTDAEGKEQAFAFRDITRGIAWLIEQPLNLSRSLFERGFRDFLGIKDLDIARLPWPFLTVMAGVFGHYVGGWRMAALGAGGFLYFVLFGVWDDAMKTFVLVIVTVPVAALAGLALGIAAARHPRFERVLTPFLDIMQSTPHFAYLVPVVVLFGFGLVPALIATAIFAAPPMVRCAILGIRTVPAPVAEAGTMAGTTARQQLWKVLLPAARPTLMVGVNQVIMQTLAMVVIASLIGAAGLGNALLHALEMLRIGVALELGLAIVVMAIVLDRLSQAYAQLKPQHREPGLGWLRRHPHLALALALGTVAILLGAVAEPLHSWPDDWSVTTAPVWDALVDWIATHLYEPLQAFRDFMLVSVLIPLRDALLWLPMPGVVALVAAIGWRVGGWRLGLLCAALMLFPALNGLWRPAMVTVYMIGSAVVLCILIGFPIGLAASRNDRVSRAVTIVCDTLQTFPSFIYLIPVVMLFKVSDLSAILAVIVYATVPMIRYTNLGLRGVSRETVEAATAMGCTRSQKLWQVEMPLALPTILLGLNQTIMMGLFMVAITALIGTQDLGQEINRARTDADPGLALVAGLSIAFFGIAAARIIGRAAARRKRDLGLA
ncbi:MAG: ABC transporter permease subunit [Alphaproteobacteria bacterium]